MAPVIGIQYALHALKTPPPDVNTEGLVELVTKQVGPRVASDKWSYPDFVDLGNASTGMAMTGWARGSADVVVPGSDKTTVPVQFVSSNYFRTIGVALARGPGFPDTRDLAVLLSVAFWQKRLAADPDTVGTMLTVNGVPHAVVGIAAERFTGHLPLMETDLFLPLERHPNLLAGSEDPASIASVNLRRFDRSRTWVHIHGRLSPGADMTQASAAVSAFTAQLAKEYPATNESTAGEVMPYHTIGNIEGQELGIITVLWNVMTVIPLLVVCLNVSGMVQVRSAMRERELSIRQAIGASRRRLMQHLLAESVVLAALGCTLAMLLLFTLPPLVSWWVGEPLPDFVQAALTIDLRMIATCAGLCLATTLVFGWLPASRFSRPVIMTVLKDETGTGGLRAGRVHRIASALQVAIAVPLLILSAMSLERVRATASADLGFAAEVLYAAPLELRTEPEQIRRVRASLARTSGVASVTVADGLPMDFRYRLARISTHVGEREAPTVAQAHVTRVGDGYVDTMAIPILAGRSVTPEDGPSAPLVTVVSKALADVLFPAGNAIGQAVSFEAGGGPGKKVQALTIVGVMADFPTSQIGTAREQLLLPLAQHPDVRRDSVAIGDDRERGPGLMLVARAAAGEPPAKLRVALENAIREVNPDFDRAAIVTGVSLRENSVADFLNTSTVSGVGGGVSLLLAALGIYGVIGLMVTTRLREIAVRLTLGASRRRVIGMILFDVIKLVGPGVLAGALITLALVRLEGGITVSTVEPIAYFVGAAIALLTAVLAGLAPARRAASVQPMIAMRST